MPHSRNRLLARLGVSDIDRFRPYLTVTELHHGQVLADTHQSVDKVYFPHEGIISCVVDLKNGEGIETGMMGADGAFDTMQALDDKVSLNRVVIQVPGTASIIEGGRLTTPPRIGLRAVVRLMILPPAIALSSRRTRIMPKSGSTVTSANC